MGYQQGYAPIQAHYCGDERFRYTLGNNGKNTLLCFGINPSTADENKPDQTIHKLIKICKKWEFDSYIMMNPCPIRSPKPADLPLEIDSYKHNFQMNFEYIEKVFANIRGGTVLASWGNFVMERPYLLENIIKIYNISKKYDIKWKYLGTLTGRGHPRHLQLRGMSEKEILELRFEDIDMDTYVQKLARKKVSQSAPK